MVFAHCSTGSTMAAFPAVAGLTGGLLAFLPELSAMLAPARSPRPHGGSKLDVVALARLAEWRRWAIF